MNQDTIDQLIDQAPLVAHEEAMRAGAVRLAAARASLPAAQAAHAAAKADAEAAEVGANDLDPMLADEVLAAAERRLAVAERVLAKAETGVQSTNANRFIAQGEAYRPVYVEGIKRRMAAAAKADKARASLAETQTEYDGATELLRHATANGTPNLFGDVAGPHHEMATLEEETKRWSPRGWWAGLPVAG